MVRKTVRHVGYVPELYEDARSEKLYVKSYQNYTKMHGQKNCASSWLRTRIIRRCKVRKIVRQVLSELYEDARSEKLCVKLVTYQNYTKMQVRKIVRQVGYLPELYEDARSENIKKNT